MANCFEVITKKEIDCIMQIDSSISSTPKEYCTSNRISYYLLLNTWGNIFSEYSPVSWTHIKTIMCTKGLLKVLSILDSESQKLIHSSGDLLPLTREIITDLSLYPEADKLVLQLLRFGKRFSPSLADKIQQNTINDFLSIENRSKLVARRSIPNWVEDGIRYYLNQLFKGYKKDNLDRYFSSGVCLDGKVLSEKLSSFGTKGISPYGTEYCFLGNGYSPVQYCSDYYSDSTEWYPDKRLARVNLAKVVSVPKSYKSARIIAEEETYRQFNNSAIYKGMLRCMKSSKYWNEFCIEDQSINRSFCIKASIDNSFATLDLSHASDCVLKHYIYMFPERLRKDLLEGLPSHYIIPGKVDSPRRLQMAATAGCVVTFVIETSVFWAIINTCRDFFMAVTNSKVQRCSVYGDDIIVPTEMAEFTVDVLERLGFIVNHDKSFFGQEFYRESCGAECFHGMDVSTEYWPRKVLNFNTKDGKVVKGNDTSLSLTSILSLQHAIYKHRCASAFISTFVREIYPDFTSSDPAEGYSDLWESFPIFSVSTPPHKKGITVPEDITRELHYTPVTRYPSSTPSGVDLMNCEMYNYIQFLLHGPYFEDPWMEACGCSSPRNPIDTMVSQPSIKWVKTSN